MSQFEDLSVDRLLRGVPERDGRKFLDPVLLRARLGAGGMGAVYLGRHLNLGIEVAVKCLKRSLAEEDEDFVRRFQREARLAAEMSNEHLVRVFDIREQGDLHYLVMEFIDGESLGERVRRDGVLPGEEAIRIIRDAARGLAPAHRRGVVHRDIKPDNILLTREGVVKVADLGIAHAASGDSLHTRTGLVFGTPSYMPPEQFEGARNVAPPGDVWSLAVTLVHLIIGRCPIEPGTFPEVLRRVCFEPFPDLSGLADWPPELLALIERATRRHPEERFQDAGTFADALDACLTSRSDEHWASTAPIDRQIEVTVKAGSDRKIRESGASKTPVPRKKRDQKGDRHGAASAAREREAAVEGASLEGHESGERSPRRKERPAILQLLAGAVLLWTPFWVMPLGIMGLSLLVTLIDEVFDGKPAFLMRGFDVLLAFNDGPNGWIYDVGFSEHPIVAIAVKALASAYPAWKALEVLGQDVESDWKEWIGISTVLQVIGFLILCAYLAFTA